MAARIRAREVSPVEAAGAYLRRVDEANPQLNAVVAVAPDALERAREAEDALARGEPVGALHGVPVTVKDTIDARGLPASCGSLVRAGRVPEEDAPAVARLRAAGAIILGKTNCAEFALDYTSENPVHGRTKNPHDPARTPGGSSGGCAAAVSARLTAASLGSDLAGSVRIPAHFCGVLGLRPTAGRVQGGGQSPPGTGLHSLGSTVGPLARTVEDLRLLFRVLTGRTPAPEPGEETAEGAGEADGRLLKGLRVAFYTGAGGVPVSAETRAAVRDAARALADAGAEVFEEVPPGVAAATELWLSLFGYATQRFIRRAYEGREPEAGRAARLILELAARRGEPALEEILRAWEERDRARAALLGWMERAPLYVAPVGAVPAFLHEEFGRVEAGGRNVSTFRAFSDSQAANVYDLPAVSVPASATGAGLPVGVQVVGRPFEERRALAAARVIEKALGGWRPPPADFGAGESLPKTDANPL